VLENGALCCTGQRLVSEQPVYDAVGRKAAKYRSRCGLNSAGNNHMVPEQMVDDGLLRRGMVSTAATGQLCRLSFSVPHALLFTHRNADSLASHSLSLHALGVIAALDVCAVSNICTQLFRWPLLPRLRGPRPHGDKRLRYRHLLLLLLLLLL
jgi:hypothetical protein